MATINDYWALITSEHNQKPKYISMLGVLGEPFVNGQNVALSLNGLYDIDVALGDQEDTLGKWVGLDRELPVPISGVYFAWNTAGVGWNQGSWKGTFDSITGLVSLDDDTYRLFLRAVIGANHWDGTMASWQTTINYVFEGTGTTVTLIDHQNMSIDIAITGNTPSALALSLIKSGYLNLKPAAVHVNGYFSAGVMSAPIFAWNATAGSGFGGWDQGAWAITL